MELLRVKNLRKYFDSKAGFGKRVIKAVEDISFSIDKNRVFALVGESGCGKSTVARLVLRLMTPTS